MGNFRKQNGTRVDYKEENTLAGKWERWSMEKVATLRPRRSLPMVLARDDRMDLELWQWRRAEIISYKGGKQGVPKAAVELSHRHLPGVRGRQAGNGLSLPLNVPLLVRLPVQCHPPPHP